MKEEEEDEEEEDEGEIKWDGKVDRNKLFFIEKSERNKVIDHRKEVGGI